MSLCRAVALILVASFTLATAVPAHASVAYITNEIKAPDFNATDLDGKEHSLSDYEGKTILLMFWATWCGPCRIEIPHLNALSKKYKDKGFVVISVSLDHKGVEHVKKFVTRAKIEYPVWMVNKDTLLKYEGVPNIPTSYLIDEKGFMKVRLVGAHDKATFEHEIKKLLK